MSRDDITIYRLSNTENILARPQPRTNCLKNGFSYSGTELWNSLSKDLNSTVLNEYTVFLKGSSVHV